jgi:hypothetical protein
VLYRHAFERSFGIAQGRGVQAAGPQRDVANVDTCLARLIHGRTLSGGGETIQFKGVLEGINETNGCGDCPWFAEA